MDTRLLNLKMALDSAVEGMTSEQMSWSPEGKWCAAEVLEHLYLSYTGTTKAFERLLEAGKPIATRRSMKHRFQHLVVFGFGYLPEGRKAPAATVPKGLPREAVKSEMGAKIEAMDAIIGKCEMDFGSRTSLLDHPVLGPLTGRQWKEFHLLHGMHHRKQLLRLREGYARG